MLRNALGLFLCGAGAWAQDERCEELADHEA
eukprot:COSAG06_NODE_6347_length_2974_cov_2.336696_5_plen_30_part_01